MVKVEGRRIIRAPVQKVFQLVSRLDASPRVTGLWLTADLVERQGNTLTVQYRGYFAGIPIESLQRATLHAPHRIDFRQTRGGLKAFRGQYLLRPLEGDTEVALTLEAEAGIPFVSDQASRLVLHAFIERSLEKFKLVAERELPRVTRRAAEGAAAKGAAPAAGGITGRPGEMEPAEMEPGETESTEVEPPAEEAAEAPAAPQAPAPASSGGPEAAAAAPPSRKRRRRRRRRGGRGRRGQNGGAKSGGTPGPS